MSERTNEQHVKALQRLLDIVNSQGKTTEFSPALEAAIEALQKDAPADQDSGLKLADDVSNQLLAMAAQVRSTTLSPSQRTAAATKLVRLGGGK